MPKQLGGLLERRRGRRRRTGISVIEMRHAYPWGELRPVPERPRQTHIGSRAAVAGRSGTKWRVGPKWPSGSSGGREQRLSACSTDAAIERVSLDQSRTVAPDVDGAGCG
jgi:hypothetical protein